MSRIELAAMNDHATCDDAPILEFRHVSVGFDEKLALDDVSFSLRRGEMICITGLSGSGKTTLLRAAAGLIKPDSGQIFINGEEIENLGEEALLDIRSRLVGLVFQDEALFTGMTAFENAAFRLTEHEWPEDAAKAAVAELLRFVGLDGAEDKMPEELSGGMRRRLEFARALMGWPSLMLYDEPTAGLDPINTKHILNLIVQGRDLHGISSLFVSKELNQIRYLTTHVAIEENGHASVLKSHPDRWSEHRVIVLESGRRTFWGTFAEFESSALPSVLALTHPETLPRAKDDFVPEEWLRAARPSKPAVAPDTKR
jgi:phospholipid/cholesterol/gamma-HCH transport system ATP-binding protein